MRVWPKDEDDDDYEGDGDYGDFGDDDLGACTVQAGVAYISGYRQCSESTRSITFPAVLLHTTKEITGIISPKLSVLSLINTIQRSPVCYLIWLRRNPRGTFHLF